jgi:putative membrane protein
MPMFEYGSSSSGWDIALMSLAMLVIWGLAIWAICYLVIGRSNRRLESGPDEARSILNQRLAKGEIDQDEYRQLIELLDASGRTPVAGVGR